MTSFSVLKNQLPNLGIGLGLRRELATDTLDSQSSIDWVEIIPENYMDLGGKARERLEVAAARFPIVTHGINLSIGSADDLNIDYLRSLKKLLDKIDAPWWSDHLCFTSIDGIYIQDLLPLPLNIESARHIAARAREVQEFIERPFLLENISYYMMMPGSNMTETEFITEIVERADCGLLLDVNNVYVNSINHNFDPVSYLNNLPLERVVQIHVAGHKKIGDFIIDTHGATVIEPVYDLLDHVMRHTQVNAVLLERDQNYPEFSELLVEIGRLRSIANDAGQYLGIRSHSKPPMTLSFKEDMSKQGREVRVLSA